MKGLHKRSCCEFGSYKHVAEDAYALSSNHGVDRMQFLPEAQVVHILEFRHVAPLAAGNGEPSLPGWRLKIGWRPIAMDQDMSAKVSGSPQVRGQQFRIADWSFLAQLSDDAIDTMID